MVNIIKPKRSNTASNMPTTTNLSSGELAVNMADQKIYINNGTAIVQIGAGKISALNDVTLTSLTSGQTISWNGTAWVNSSAGSGDMVLASIQTVTGAKTFGAAGAVGKLIIAGTTSGTTILNATAAAGAGTVTLPTTGTLATLAGAESLSNKTLVAPALGTPASGVATNLTGTAASLTAGNVTTNANLTGMVTSVGNAASLGSFTSLQLLTALTNETGTGAAVFATSPTLVTPVLGTPSSGTLTNCTGLPTAGLVNDAVTYAKIQNVTTARLLGRATAGAGDTEEITLGTNLSYTGTTLNAASGSAAGITVGATSTNPTAAGTSATGVGHKGTAGANYSTAIGAGSADIGATTATGAGAMALGGSHASGVDSFAAAIANNTSSYGAQTAQSIAIGDHAVCNGGGQAIAIGGFCVASGTSSVAISGYFATASGSESVAIGLYNTASGNKSMALGYGAIARTSGKYAYAGFQAFGGSGNAQKGVLVIFVATTDATATRLVSNTQAADTVNQVILPNNSAYTFTGTVVARQQAADGTASAAWKVEGLIRRESTAASTVLVASTVTTISNVSAWTLALTADTTNGGLAVTGTGAAATNIRWVATIETTELIYA